MRFAGWTQPARTNLIGIPFGVICSFDRATASLYLPGRILVHRSAEGRKGSSMSELEGWDNFYVILGSAAAGLTGLTFVIIALLSDARRPNPAGMSGYITPTIVHFGTVLGLSAFLSVPHQTILSVSVGFGATGIGTLIYTGIIAKNVHRFGTDYVPVIEDWVWHVILPTLAYGALLVMAFLIWGHPQQSVYGIAASLTLLLFIGIHNAWDVAVSVTVSKQKDRPPPPAA